MNEHNEILVALVGQPNSGKSTVFNYLTGLHQTIANYPGVTVTKKSGHYHDDKRRIEVVDLPGTYSLTSYSQEERVTRDFLLLERPEVVVIVVDAANLRRHLYFVFQLLELQIPLVVCLNMMDIAERRGLEIDVQKLEQELGVPVIPAIARNNRHSKNEQTDKNFGLEKLRSTINEISQKHAHESPLVWKINYGKLEPLISEFDAALSEKPPLVQDFPSRWLAVKLLENDREARRIIQHHTHDADWEKLLENCTQKAKDYEKSEGDSPRKTIAAQRNNYAEKLEQKTIRRIMKPKRNSDMLDKILCHPLGGLLCVGLVMFGIFKLAFSVSDDWEWFPWISEEFGFQFTTPVSAVQSIFDNWIPMFLDFCFGLPEGDLRSLIYDGIVSGVGGVLVFMPTIFFIFLFMALLEQSGYVARVIVVMDRIMRFFGIHGQSILPLILGGGIIGGCAIPAVMATRTMREQRERILTIMIIPLMNCGAKIPVYALLISAFFVANKELVMAAIIFISWTLALISSLILGKTIVRGKSSPLIIELPTYQPPNFYDMLLSASLQSWWFVKKAGTIILAVNVFLWVLMYYPRLDDKSATASEQLANSYAAKIGRTFEPVSKYMGFDWRDNVALLGGFIAKEVIVSSLATMYGIESGDENITEENEISHADPINTPENVNYISENELYLEDIDYNNCRYLASNLDSEKDLSLSSIELDERSKRLAVHLRSEKSWTTLKAFVFILFVMVYAPCVATCAIIWRETGHIKYMLASAIYATTVAIIIALAVYQIGTLITTVL
ncbi:MAG: ferrous iron transport protein B [Planctomycetaceae bacterium]|jgi:ferrous iron transport protein B|nr:ferrous iron transport protein B [Planctomycetaceae bacterium]